MVRTTVDFSLPPFLFSVQYVSSCGGLLGHGQLAEAAVMQSDGPDMAMLPTPAAEEGNVVRVLDTHGGERMCRCCSAALLDRDFTMSRSLAPGRYAGPTKVSLSAASPLGTPPMPGCFAIAFGIVSSGGLSIPSYDADADAKAAGRQSSGTWFMSRLACAGMVRPVAALGNHWCGHRYVISSGVYARDR